MSKVFERDPGLSDLEFSMQETAHRFAKEVMRPIGQQLDRMDPEQAFAKDSPYWEARKKFCELGLHMADLFGEVTPMELSRINGLVSEELGWGDYGLAGSFFAAGFPAHLAMMSGRPELMEQFNFNTIGCWGLTEPNHGSDQIDYSQAISPHPREGEASDCVLIPR
jgi:acyl-CoA dehydrogenase